MTEKKQTGGPAFPRPYSEADAGKRTNPFYEQDGMSLRDYFAGQALQAIMHHKLSQPLEPGYDTREGCAKGYSESAYVIADAMLKAREA